MQALKRAAAVIISMVATFAFSTPAYAASCTVNSPAGDYVNWNAYTRILSVCDYSRNNGTATARLETIGGSTWQKSDGNGAQDGCDHLGPLNVDESKSAILYACTSASTSYCNTKYFDL